MPLARLNRQLVEAASCRLATELVRRDTPLLMREGGEDDG
jgi:hypothetical protein